MRLTVVVAAVALLAGCMDPLAVNPNTGIELMKGAGSASVSPAGGRSFRYVFPKQAGTDRHHHEAMISQWAARTDGCPAGYTISSVETVQGMLVYSGPCR